ncbi:MAG: prolyl oligopeptidase family serine peptidase [Candidatus Symbiothrix sp.]|jgi:predicted esterase|nr:prolyl oligopeptidase family serine peptidase [Candidatus Symbiothrix sp.]
MKKIYCLAICVLVAVSSAFAADYEHLYIVGNATEAGWNPGAAPEMTNVEAGVFTWTGVLIANQGEQERFKFLVARDWHPSFTCRLDVNSHLVIEAGEEYDLYIRPTGTEGYDNAFQAPSEGTYRVDVNLNTMKMTCTKISDDGQPDLELFTRETFQTSSGQSLNYRKLAPLSLETDKKYPLVIFMHGAGERGSDNNNQLTHGATQFITTSNRETFPAYVLFPQCPSQYFWALDPSPSSYDATTFPVDYPIAPAMQQVKELLDYYLQLPEIDTERVYITGISMGGMATFDMVCRFPGVFAAAVPICGGVNVERLNTRVKNVYWRIFHGDADGVVPVQNSRDANSKLVEAGADVEYIEYPGVNHDVWTPVFQRTDFLSWLFSKTRIPASETGIENADCAIVDVQYYNLQGVRVRSGFACPQQRGIYIVKSMYESGKTVSQVIINQ